MLPGIQPIAPKRIHVPFDHAEFVFELKMDGWRCMTYIEDGACRLISRKQNLFKSFGPLNAAVSKLPVQNAIIDSEIVCLDANLWLHFHGHSRNKAMIVVPNEAVYEPKFSYLWGLAEERFPEELATKVDRPTALREIARCFLKGAGMTLPGELARVTGLTRPEAGIGNRALVEEGYAVKVAQGTYRLAALGRTGSRIHSHDLPRFEERPPINR